MKTRLTRGEDTATVARDGALVTLEAPGGPPASVWFDHAEVAVVAFEANVAALEGEGYCVVATEVGDLIAAFAPLDDAGPGTSVSLDAGALVRAHIAASDPVSIRDNLGGLVASAPALGRFDPETADPSAYVDHALRALGAWTGPKPCPRLGIEGVAPWTARVLDACARSGWGDRLTHLWLSELDPRRPGEIPLSARPIALEFPALRGLACAHGSWLRWSDAPFLMLDRLRLHAPASEAPGQPSPRLAHVLDRVDVAAPGLRHLSLWAPPFDADAIDEISRHRVLERLAVLDLFRVHHPFDFEALLARRDRFAHLEALVLGGHLVPESVRQRFSDWPQVVFASFDRRERADDDRAWAEAPSFGASTPRGVR